MSGVWSELGNRMETARLAVTSPEDRWGYNALLKEKAPHLQGFRVVERIGIEPMTSSLQN